MHRCLKQFPESHSQVVLLSHFAQHCGAGQLCWQISQFAATANKSPGPPLCVSTQGLPSSSKGRPALLFPHDIQLVCNAIEDLNEKKEHIQTAGCGESPGTVPRANLPFAPIHSVFCSELQGRGPLVHTRLARVKRPSLQHRSRGNGTGSGGA